MTGIRTLATSAIAIAIRYVHLMSKPVKLPDHTVRRLALPM
jgi:hypothetical protein